MERNRKWSYSHFGGRGTARGEVHDCGFAKQEYETYILIDFNKASKAIIALWDDLNDLNVIFPRSEYKNL